MGTAKIIDHIADGKYEVDYYYDNTAIKSALVDYKNTLIDIETNIPIDEAILQTYLDAIDTKKDELDIAIDAYKTCVDELPENPSGDYCPTELKAITDLQLEILEIKKQAAPAQDRVDTLNAEQIEIKKLIELYESYDSTKRMTIWCIDCCDRPESESPTGEWYGHALIIPDDTFVNTVDVWGATGVIEIMIDSSYDTPEPAVYCEEGILSQDKFGWAYNWVMVAPQETWKPSFRKATLESINKSAQTATVSILSSKYDDYDLNTQLTGTIDVDVDYMGCEKGLPFKKGDEVVIAFNGNISAPVVVGYTNNPQPCKKIYKTGYTFVDGDTVTGWTAYNLEKNIITGVWEVASNTKGLGTPQHWKDPDSDYVIGWMIAEKAANLNDITYESVRWTPYQNSIQVDGVWHSIGRSINCACLDSNGNIIVASRSCNYNSVDGDYDHVARIDYYTGSMSYIGNIFNESATSQLSNGDFFKSPVTNEFLAVWIAGSFNADGTSIVGRIKGFDIELNLDTYIITSVENSDDPSPAGMFGDAGVYYDEDNDTTFGTATAWTKSGYEMGFGALFSTGLAKTICPKFDMPDGFLYKYNSQTAGHAGGGWAKYAGGSCTIDFTNHDGNVRQIDISTTFFDDGNAEVPSVNVYDFMHLPQTSDPETRNQQLNNKIEYSGGIPRWTCGTLEETYVVNFQHTEIGAEGSDTTTGWTMEGYDGELLTVGSKSDDSGWYDYSFVVFPTTGHQTLFALRGFDGEWGWALGRESFQNPALTPDPAYYFSGADLDDLIPTLQSSTNNIYLLGVYLIPD